MRIALSLEEIAKDWGHLLLVIYLLLSRHQQMEGTAEDALFTAVYEGNVDAVYELIFGDVDVNSKNEAGNGPLHAAAHIGNARLICILVKAGAKLGLRGRSGNSPLHFAAYRNHMDAVKELLRLGADPLARNDTSKSPRDVCVTSQHANIATLLDDWVLKRCSFLLPSPARMDDKLKSVSDHANEKKTNERQDDRIVLPLPPPVFPSMNFNKAKAKSSFQPLHLNSSGLSRNNPQQNAKSGMAPALSKLSLGSFRPRPLQLRSSSSSSHDLLARRESAASLINEKEAAKVERKLDFADLESENNRNNHTYLHTNTV